ncbi:MAG: CrcB family protein [Lactobacillales bacterium]|nr:CrcB family protein [Lactobacillales bacterium]
MKVNYLIIGIFGFFGGLARFGLSTVIPKIGGFPLVTCVINLVGCFMFAYLVKNYLVAKKVHERLILGIGTGFIGSFTTFSSCMLDFSLLIQEKNFLFAFIYALVSVVGGLGMVTLGMKFGRKHFEVKR